MSRLTDYVGKLESQLDDEDTLREQRDKARAEAAEAAESLRDCRAVLEQERAHHRHRTEELERARDEVQTLIERSRKLQEREDMLAAGDFHKSRDRSIGWTFTIGSGGKTESFWGKTPNLAFKAACDALRGRG